MSCSFACFYLLFFFFNDTATTEIYTLSLHDALPICDSSQAREYEPVLTPVRPSACRSEEHTSELQSPDHLVCRLLLEKKNKKQKKLIRTKKKTKRPSNNSKSVQH